MSKHEKKRTSVNLIMICLILLVMIIGVTYAWLIKTIYGNNVNSMTVGILSLNLEEHEYINITGEDAVPLSKTTALSKTNNIYNFDITNNGNTDSEYTIYLEVENENGINTIPNNLIRYILTKNNVDNDDLLLSNAPKESLTGEDNGKIILDSSNLNNNSKVLKPNETNNYSLRLWIDETATSAITNCIFKSKIKVVATQIK